MRHIGYVAASLAASCVLVAGNASAASASSGRSEPSDTQISRDIASDLIRDTAIGPYGVWVRSRDGMVELRGAVATVKDWKRAEEDARNAEGVDEVQNNLSILVR